MTDIPLMHSKTPARTLPENDGVAVPAETGNTTTTAHKDVDPVLHATETLINMDRILKEHGLCADNNISNKNVLHHSRAEKAITQLCKEHYLQENRLPDIKISPSTYNPEEIDTKRAEELALKYKNTSQFKYDKDAVDTFRTRFRQARQAAMRSQIAPCRTSSDGGNNAIFQYHKTVVSESRQDAEIYWGRPGLDYSSAAKLYDIELPDGTKHTVFLEISALKTEIANALQECNDTKQLAETDLMAIDALMVNPAIPGHAILHQFNTSYADITLRAADLHAAGFSHVMTSPPLTWRDTGPNTPLEAKGQWYHAYQPEDIRVIDNPHGNLQEYTEMIDVLKGYGIGVIADVALNFMGTSGDAGTGGDDHRGTLIYPSKDIRESWSREIDMATGKLEAQVLLTTLKQPSGEPVTQYPNMPYTSEYDFESNRGELGAGDWDNMFALRTGRLLGMPKISPDSKWIMDAQRDYLIALKRLGVQGFRIDAEKHIKPEHLNCVMTQEITAGMLVFGETITPGPDDRVWVDYLRSRIKERKDIGAYDFPLQNKLTSAFKFGGNMQDLKITDEYSPSPIESFQSVAFTVNHDIPNNGAIFGHMLFGHQVDEILANSYILSIPGIMPLMYSDGRVQKSVVEIPREGSSSLGGEAWTNGWNSEAMRSMVAFHNNYHDQPGIWFAYEGNLASPTCLAFSRGEGPVAEGKRHSAVVIINKAAEPISPVDWPNPLQPGTYKDYGPDNKGLFTVNAEGRFDPPLVAGGRTALMLALESKKTN